MRTPAASVARPHLLPVIGLGVLLAAAAPARAGDMMRVYRDPATGAFIPPPVAPPTAGSPVPSAADHALGGAPQLVEVPGATSAGGVIVDLQGAYQSEISATVDPSGHVVTHCTQTAPR